MGTVIEVFELLQPAAGLLLPAMISAVLSVEDVDGGLNSLFIDTVLTVLHWTNKGHEVSASTCE